MKYKDHLFGEQSLVGSPFLWCVRRNKLKIRVRVSQFFQLPGPPCDIAIAQIGDPYQYFYYASEIPVPDWKGYLKQTPYHLVCMAKALPDTLPFVKSWSDGECCVGYGTIGAALYAKAHVHVHEKGWLHELSFVTPDSCLMLSNKLPLNFSATSDDVFANLVTSRWRTMTNVWTTILSEMLTIMDI